MRGGTDAGSGGSGGEPFEEAGIGGAGLGGLAGHEASVDGAGGRFIEEAQGGAGGEGGEGIRGAGGMPGTGGLVASTILSVDFVGGFNASGATAGAPGTIPVMSGPVMGASDVAGLKPAAHWNAAFGAVGALPMLALSDGTLGTTTLSWTSPPSTTRSGVWRLGFDDPRPDAIMMDGYLDPPSVDTPAEVVVANLPPAFASRGYDVYVYCMGAISTAAQTRTYDYQIGSTRISAAQTGPVPLLFPGYQIVPANGGAGNVVVFHGLTGPGFTLTATPGTGSSSRAPLNGIQIVSPPG